MKKFYLLTKTLLVAVCLLAGASNVWGDAVVVPTPVYFNDFSFAVNGQDGIEIVGNGVFEDDADVRFGRIFHNDPTLTKAVRTNYLKLPADVLSHSGTSKEMTIGFWVNMKNAEDFWSSPIFSAYESVEKVNTWPMFAAWAGGTLQVNCWGWSDFTASQNDNASNAYDTFWLDDKEWHYYTITMTATKVIVYIDGVIKNSWTLKNNDDETGEKIEGLFNGGAANALPYVCLGGCQPWGGDVIDPAFGFDDFAVYDVELSKTQIDQIRTNKLNRTVTGTRVGKVDNSTEYLSATSSKITLKPGESYHYSFINYNNGSTNHNNWMLPVYNSSDENVIAVRLDNWEDKHHVEATWGSNAGCTSNFNWTNFPGNVNGATVDMTVTFTANKVFNMSSTINTVDGSTWNYSYTNDYTDSPISLTSNDYIKVALSVSRSWLDITSQGYSAVSTTIGANGYTTFASPYPLDLTSATQTENGFTAYKASSINETTVQFTDGINQNVAANTGVLLSGTANATVTIPVVASGTVLEGNALRVNESGSTFVADPDYTYYGMIKDSDPLTFGTFAPGSVAIPANKAYLKVSDSGVLGAREIRAVFGDITGINEAAATAEATQMDGKFIENGKLVIVKNGKKFNANGTEIK